MPPGADAITIGSLIFLRRRADADERLIRHELVHVEQWRHHGVACFLGRYLGTYLRWRLRGHGHHDAYRRIPMEVQAYWRSRQPVRGRASDRPAMPS